MTLQQWTRGIDSSGFHPNPEDVKRNGGSFIIRYSAGAANNPNHPSHHKVAWKLCGPDEVARAERAGVDFIANSEWYESRATEGASAAAEDAPADLDFWRSRGYSKGAVIAISWDDKQPNRSKHDALEEYLRRYDAVLKGYYCIGLYAGDVALHEMFSRGAIVFGWRAMSESWSADEPKGAHFFTPGGRWKEVAQQVAKVSPAHLAQNGNGWYVIDGKPQADENAVLRPFAHTHLGMKGSSAAALKLRPTGASSRPISGAAHGTYVIKSGDTFWALEVAHHWPHGTLQKLNPSANPTRLQVGQTIVIP